MTDSSSTSPPLGRREQLVHRVASGLAVIAGVLLLAVFAINIAQIFGRPIMGGWIWINDLSRLTIAWVVMIGAAAAYGLREHLVVDFVIERVPPKVATGLAYIIRALELSIGFILLVAGATVATSRMNIQYIQLGIPTGYAYWAVAVLGFFLVVFGLLMSVSSPTRHSTIDPDVEPAVTPKEPS